MWGAGSQGQCAITPGHKPDSDFRGQGPLLELEAAMRWVSGCLIGDGWEKNSTFDKLGDDIRVRKAKRIRPKQPKPKAAKVKKTAEAEAAEERPDPQAAIMQMDAAWHRTGHDFIGKPLMRAEYTEDDRFAGYVTGT